MGVSVTTTATDITVSVNDQSISASVGGGIGPQGPASTAAAGVSTLNGLTGTLTVQAGSNITVTTGTAGLTITGASGGASAVSSVAGRTGAVTLTTADIGGLAAIASTGSANDLTSGTVPSNLLPHATTSRDGVITVGSGLSVSSGNLSSDVRTVAGRTGNVTLTTSDIGGYSSPPVASVAGRTGTVTLTSADLSDFATAAAKYGPVTSVNGLTGTVTITAGGESFHPFLVSGM